MTEKSKEYGNFLVVENESSIVMKDKLGFWETKYNAGTDAYTGLSYYLNNKDEDEVKFLITIIFWSSSRILTDMDFVKVITDYFDKTINDFDAPEENSEEQKSQEKKDLKIVKNMTDGKEEEEEKE